MSIILKLEDCLEYMRTMPDNSVDLVVTDCPYKIVSGGCHGHRSGIFKRDIDEVRQGKLYTENNVQFSDWLPDLFRILKQGSHCYIMINDRNLARLQYDAEDVGFKFQRLLVWEKNNVTPCRYYMSNAEYILMLRKGRAKSINDMSSKVVIQMNNIIGKKVHPTQKPVDLMEIFIQNSSNIGDVVFDPFMGSGSTGVACVNTDRSFVGVEVDEMYFNIAKSRIDEAILMKESDVE